MKKLLILFSVILIFSTLLSSCGGNVSDETQNNGTEAETQASREPKPLTDATIKNARPFSDGVAFVEYADKSVAIDTNGNVLFALTKGSTFEFASTETRSYKDGVIVIGNGIFDKTGKAVEYDKSNGFEAILTDSADGYMLAKGKTDGEFSLGILKTDGTWSVPLSEENRLAKYYVDNRIRTDSLRFTDGYDYYGGPLVRVNIDWETRFYYDLSTNVITDDYVRYVTESSGENAGIRKFDADGNSVLLIKDKGLIDNGVVEDRIFCYDLKNERHIFLYDTDGNLIRDFEDKIYYNTSGYEGESLFFHKDGKIVVSQFSESGMSFLVIDKDGNEVFKPVPAGNYDSVCAFDGETVVFSSYEQGVFYSFGKDGVLHASDGTFDGFLGYGDGMLLMKNMFDQVFFTDMQFNVVIK